MQTIALLPTMVPADDVANLPDGQGAKPAKGVARRMPFRIGDEKTSAASAGRYVPAAPFAGPP